MPVFDKATTAWADYGLAGKQLSILLASDVASFGREGMGLELELLLHTGRVKDVRGGRPEAAKGCWEPNNTAKCGFNWTRPRKTTRRRTTI